MTRSRVPWTRSTEGSTDGLTAGARLAAAGPTRGSAGSGAERGVSSLEVLGIMLVAGTVVGAVAFTVTSESAGDKMGAAFCTITSGGDCSGGGGTAAGTGGDGETCVGAPPGAAGPVRGLVRLDGNHTGSVGVMGDGTFQVYGHGGGSGGGSIGGGSGAAGGGSAGGGSSAPTSTTWATRNLSAGAVTGLEPLFTGQADTVYSANGPADLAGIIAADTRQTWSESVFGDESSVLGSSASAVGDFVLASAGDGEGLPDPTATFIDTGVDAGLSLNAYAQTVAMDAGGEAVGVVEHANGATTEVVGVSDDTSGGASDVIPMLLHVDRDPSGNITAVRTVSDRSMSGEDHAATASLFVTHLDTTTGSNDKVVRDLAAAIGATNLSGGAPASTGTPGTGGEGSGTDGSGSDGSGTDGSGSVGSGTVGSDAGTGSDGGSGSGAAAPSAFESAASSFVTAALRDGYVNRQAPAGTVSTEGSGVDAIEAGLRQVTKSAPPESFNGVDWTSRTPGCRG